ncbi:uncharacterized protein MONOS_8905 [Monocercomonoides exilis]|uniref:uncharacterized protein n=1 Tax=Monocercomonoides exilis TaxID=2049356 RepID=UPI0035597924|nr:hypothetical protein MONOS_8905 [Monocercomonoides exilis]|eukprot:MONOS_8905.1-p1 / transcript=MONOS_8905.1 / gene=MONOS_8905 / organism=Monocercomonoides_exilis_PA203 / gene_product=unspecified product / transcript_product=unspecified product / location=Mono_scaffold00350:11147-11710(+) / protein_length=188 / sequence_SO=supercontig / SO=protein_coding / is_pseudo=false
MRELGWEEEEGASAAFVIQRKFDGRNGADSEENKINIFRYSQHVWNTWSACHNGSLHVSTQLLPSGSQHVMDLFWKQQEQPKKIPSVNIECSLFISYGARDMVTSLLYALNKNSIWNSGSCATDEKFDANDQLILFTGTITKISCKHSFLRCLDRHNGRDFGKLNGVGILRQHRADREECDGSCRDE